MKTKSKPATPAIREDETEAWRKGALMYTERVMKMTSGKPGPWTEPLIAVQRSLAACASAMEFVQMIPYRMADGVLEKELAEAVNKAYDLADDLVTRMLNEDRP